ncbi:uncharacterized protein PHALS_00678 [Plasmopara halstedii]|uniref:Uncharacterized protein n=1 Tax=Plasmopara halstedii TaxID=4781 RepID=A0A0P1ARR3_PLAHL|nr:uncharacterized protein PHALS_00678 [Plasmopara halstedii]CEG44309.1 hypothetical protein PHALS_00678 [Plasmopara halstedii]|eukprot:XP_024580678.1 hypothetical protein PHALS_00678 [Plasmopara halstedii]
MVDEPMLPVEEHIKHTAMRESEGTSNHREYDVPPQIERGYLDRILTILLGNSCANSSSTGLNATHIKTADEDYNSDPNIDDHFWSQRLKDEDDLIAEAVLAFAANVQTRIS